MLNRQRNVQSAVAVGPRAAGPLELDDVVDTCDMTCENHVRRRVRTQPHLRRIERSEGLCLKRY